LSTAAPAGVAVLKPRPRPDVVTGITQKIQTGFGAVYVTINEDEQGPFEVFAFLGKSGGYTASFTEALGRMCSLALRSGVPVEEVIKQLDGIRSPKIAFDHGETVVSVPDGLAKALRRHMKGELHKSIQSRLDSVGSTRALQQTLDKPTKVMDEEEVETMDADAASQKLVDRGDNPECPDCSNMLTLQEGCIKCLGCGYSEC
jgi:ribonucleoside-diphosphate reductase alpha chain